VGGGGAVLEKLMFSKVHRIKIRGPCMGLLCGYPWELMARIPRVHLQYRRETTNYWSSHPIWHGNSRSL